MRVTEGMKYGAALRQLGALASQQAEAQRQASTGSRIDAPSADPIAAAQVARLSASLERTDAHRTTIRSVQGDVTTAEGALAEAGDLFQRAREIAVQGSNGALSAADRTAMVSEIAGLQDRLVALANTRGSSGYLFAGSKSNAPAFDPSGNFLGDDEAHVVDLGGATATNVAVSGARAFTTAGGQDVFSTLTALGTALAANDSAGVAATLSGLDASHEQILHVRGEAGLLMSRLDASDSALETLQVNLQGATHAAADADPYAAFTRFSTLNSSLEQAVSVTRQILQTTTLNRF